MANEFEADARTGALRSLSISGFRGIGQLAIPRLGRVTLIAGRNGVGKTTVLDAVRVYAARGRFDAMQEALVRREELTTLRDKEGMLISAPALDRLFHQSDVVFRTIEIGPIDGGPMLKIEEVKDNADVSDKLYDQLVDEISDFDETMDVDEVRLLSVVFDDARILFPWQILATRDSRALRSFLRAQEGMPAPTPCQPLGPGLLDNEDVAKLWDNVALTDGETLGLAALRLVFGTRIERTAVVGERYGYGVGGRRVLVKLSDCTDPVPLKSLGEGASRMFGVALALANYRDGILLMDEAENGIHYSLHSAFWSMILQTAQTHNVQVLATTHSKDCINGFAAAALDCPDISGNLIRIDRHNGELYSVEYSKEELKTAAEQNIEVR